MRTSSSRPRSLSLSEEPEDLCVLDQCDSCEVHITPIRSYDTTRSGYLSTSSTLTDDSEDLDLDSPYSWYDLNPQQDPASTSVASRIGSYVRRLLTPRAPPYTPRVRVEVVDHSIDLASDPYLILLATRFQLQMWDPSMVHYFNPQPRKIDKRIIPSAPDGIWLD